MRFQCLQALEVKQRETRIWINTFCEDKSFCRKLKTHFRKSSGKDKTWLEKNIYKTSSAEARMDFYFFVAHKTITVVQVPKDNAAPPATRNLNLLLVGGDSIAFA